MSIFGKIKSGAEKGAKSVSKEAQKGTKEVEKGSKTIGKNAEKSAKTVSKVAKKGTKEVDKKSKSFGKKVQKDAKTISKTAKKGTIEVDKRSKKIGTDAEKGAKTASKTTNKAGKTVREKAKKATKEVERITVDAYNLSTKEVNKAVKEVQNGLEDFADEVKKISEAAMQELYKTLIKNFLEKYGKLAIELGIAQSSIIKKDPKLFLNIGADLAAGKVKDAEKNIRKLLEREEMQSVIKKAHKQLGTCFIFQIDLAAAFADVAMGGGIGIAINLDALSVYPTSMYPTSPYLSSIYTYGAVSTSYSNKNANVGGGISIGFMKGNPDNAAGFSILGSCGFDKYSGSLALFPDLGFLAISVGVGKTKGDAADGVSVGGAYGYILQKVKNPVVS